MGTHKSKIQNAKNPISIKNRIHKDKDQPDNLIRFSFRHFSINEKFPYPMSAQYIQVFLERLRDVSNWTIGEFRSKRCPSLRNHSHRWSATSEQDGYKHLSDQLQQCEPWQFCLSANEYGRIHGLLIDEVFYIIWLDINHVLYP